MILISCVRRISLVGLPLVGAPAWLCFSSAGAATAVVCYGRRHGDGHHPPVCKYINPSRGSSLLEGQQDAFVYFDVFMSLMTSSAHELMHYMHALYVDSIEYMAHHHIIPALWRCTGGALEPASFQGLK